MHTFIMYSILHLSFYVCFIDVQKLPEDVQDRSKHVGVMMDFVCKKYNFDISEFVSFIL
jgi:hypothetical protein